MALAPGTRLGVYEVTAQIGAGGMGEVYRATDSNLKRSVAIKVLPASVAGDADRLARFQREAEVLAALNHPNIAAIYGLEKTPDFTALVMELVEGEDLSQRIARGAIPIDEALPVAKQIADALEAAHEQGIIHRDLKPANIKLRADGTVKVLDFGLAKAVDPTAGSSATAMNSPTLSMHATQAGIILGTAAYMSPEQVAGKAVDKRSDLWSFGVVVMELLTGRPVFGGETVSHVLASVLKDQPGWTTLPAATPAPIRRLLRRCLEKDRKRRIADAADARLEIEDALANAVSLSDMTGSQGPTFWRYAAVALAAASIAAGMTVAWQRTSREAPTPMYTFIEAPTDYVLGENDGGVALPTRTPIVFTPDGKSIIIQAAREQNKPQLFIRSLDRPDAQPIPGTEDARVPFVSPDGRWIGFSAGTALKKVPIGGGTPTTICDIGGGLGPAGASWGVGDVIVFGKDVGRVMRVSAGGGTPEPVTPIPAARHGHVTPFFLPDGRRFLFADVSTLDASDARVMVQSLDGGDPRLVVPSATDGRLLPNGKLAFMRLGMLMTVQFDLVRVATTGDPVAALSNVMQSGLRARAGANNTGAGMYAVSARGDFVAIRGPVVGGEVSQLQWLTRDGQLSAEPASGAPVGSRLYNRISPDQTRDLVSLITPTHYELWIADWKRGVWTQCGDCKGDFGFPSIWSPDGRSMLTARFEELIAHALDGSVPDRVIVRENGRRLAPANWLADGRIVYESFPVPAPASARDLYVDIRVIEANGKDTRTLVPAGVGANPDASPDGRWLAFSSVQSVTRQVMVQPLSGESSRTQVSSVRGEDPVWSSDSRKLYYLTPRSDLNRTDVMTVDVTATPSGAPAASPPRELMHWDRAGMCNPRCFDMSTDARALRAELLLQKNRQSVTRMDFIQNWTATLPNAR